MKNSLKMFAIALISVISLGCNEDVDPGYRGFVFEKSMFGSSAGLDTSDIVSEGSRYTGMVNELRLVDCRDAEQREQIEVLTKSDITVTIDLRLTYSAKCDATSLESLLKEVPTDERNVVRSEKIYSYYVLPIVRESLRNYIAGITIEDIKNVRAELRNRILQDLEAEIKSKGHPVDIKIVAVSNMKLPLEVVEKNRSIELARQDAELQVEKQKTSKVRLERELFEAQQERLVKKEQAERNRDVAIIEAESQKNVRLIAAETDRDAKILEAEGIQAIRNQLTPNYVRFIEAGYHKDIMVEQAKSMGNGTVYYLGQDFLVAPGSAVPLTAAK